MKALDVGALQKGLRALHGRLTEDLVKRADLPEVEPVLRETHGRLSEARRTGEDFALWRRHFAAQVASSWILSTLFVRVLEDRGFMPRRRLAGEQARESRETIAQLAPHVGSREYLLLVFQELMTFEATRALFDPAHDLAWRLGPSETGARELIAFWEQPDPTEAGRLLFAFDAERAPGTRFLGDVYEELDPDAKKRFALLQTPDFVERFILDRTLEPALKTFGLGTADEPIRLIDPSCGSGHFLLGAFARLVKLWSDAAPDPGPREWATRALRSVHGTDINPYAVAITRFRLTLAAFEAGKVTALAGAPAFPLNVTVADSLLWGGEVEHQRELRDRSGAAWTSGLFDVEDLAEVERILLDTRYHVVVGNPPYITPKDATLNAEYRVRYPRVCHRSYSLGVPFTQRLFLLAIDGGYVGQITANSFMKREFGKPLIERYLPTLDLTAIYDTSGAFIPGHGTPTVILVGRNQEAKRATVPVVMGKRGEPGKPADPARGVVWTSIAEHGDEVGFENDYVSTAEVGRSTLRRHPWSLGGGGAAELKERIEAVTSRCLGQIAAGIGRSTVCGEEEAFLVPRSWAIRHRTLNVIAPLVIGEIVRDWTIDVRDDNFAVYPYQGRGSGQVIPADHWIVAHHLWSYRKLLEARTVFQKTVAERGQAWYEHLEHYRDKLATPLTITFAFVATHNNLALDRGHRLFNRTAPAIKLPDEATEDDHLRLLASLNSSTLGFWMRQVFHDKGGKAGSGGFVPEAWEHFFEYDGTKIQGAPIAASDSSLPLARRLDVLGQQASRSLLADMNGRKVGSSDSLRSEIEHRLTERRTTLARMRGLQEELDWLVYEVYGLAPAGTTRPLDADDVPPLALGHRPFEIILARRVAAGELKTAWFERHGSTATTQIPAGYPTEYRERIEARLALIESAPEIALIEQPEYKRRWSADDLDARVKRELRDLLLDRLEDTLSRSETVQSVRALASTFERDAAFRAIAQVYTDQVDISLDDLLAELLDDESVPAFDACRYTAIGLEKRAVWERVWDLQRREDDGEKVEIPLPPKYQSKDFQGNAWSHRGKLDVPKERFVSFPECEGGTDSTSIYGWAGWDHVQRARALSDVFERRRTEEGWDKHRLLPLLAGLQELLPWLLQWHNEPSEVFGGERPGDAFTSWLETQLSALALSPAELRAWRPRKGRGRAASKRVAQKVTNLADDEGAEDGLLVASASPPDEPPEPPRRRTASSAGPALDPDRVLTALRALGGTATLAALTEAIGEPQRDVRAAADALVEAGQLKQTKQRPITYSLPGREGSAFDTLP